MNVKMSLLHIFFSKTSLTDLVNSEKVKLPHVSAGVLCLQVNLDALRRNTSPLVKQGLAEPCLYYRLKTAF